VTERVCSLFVGWTSMATGLIKDVENMILGFSETLQR